MKQLAPEVEAALRDAFERGLTHAEIAAETGYAIGTVRAYMSRLRLRRRDRVADDTLRALAAEGLTTGEIARLVGFSSSHHVAYRLRRLGLRGAAPKRSRVSDDVLRAHVEEGLTTSEIAERTGLAKVTVQNRLARLGLRARRFSHSATLARAEREEAKRREREEARERRAADRVPRQTSARRPSMPLSEEEKAEARMQEVEAGCSRCTWTMRGTTEETHRAFREHPCSARLAAAA